MRSKLFILFLLVALTSVAQRRITPVDPTARRDTVATTQPDSVVAPEPEEPKKKKPRRNPSGEKEKEESI